MFRWCAKSRPFDVIVACGFIYSLEKYTNARGGHLAASHLKSHLWLRSLGLMTKLISRLHDFTGINGSHSS